MLKFDKVTVNRRGSVILDDVSFALKPHRLTVVLGKNGSGKSTLVSCVTNQVPYTGEITCFDRSLKLMPSRERARMIAVLPQTLSPASLSVEELVRLGRTPYLDLGQRMTKADREQVDEAICSAGLADLRTKRLDCLSGGERQKAYLAMILAQNTRVVILDEPTTYLDLLNAAELLQLLSDLKARHKKTLMVVLHDLTRAAEIADDFAVLNDGKLAFNGTAEDCIKSGIIEQVFSVRRTSYIKDGRELPLFYR